jgi:branched-chain amino acid transport system ATP-binding protein
MAEPTPALELDGLEVRYGPVAAVRAVSFGVNTGEIVGVIGPNGAGKSTMLHAVTGLLAIARGDIRLEGRSLRGLPPETIARAGVALVPEGRRIFGRFSVEENLRLGLAARGGTERDAVDEAYELFPVLRGFRRRQAGTLSGGEQQQLAIARAVLARPRVLLLDEPSLGLAPQAVDSVFGKLAEIRGGGLAILLVEQRAQRTVALADRTHVLANGELRVTLEPGDADDKEKLVAAYLAA